MNRKTGYQYAANPIWLASKDKPENGEVLKKLSFGKDASTESYDEEWLQNLIHQYADALPISELEPGLGRLIPVGCEVPTPAGFIDNVFVTQEGNIVLVECKLWRNPEARRKVIAQIIDYAQSISRWTYSDFDVAIQKGLNSNGKPVTRSLLDLVENVELDEARFVDAIQRNLRMGRMLLLVVGDGIREDTESLTEYLQMHAGFHFTLGLVEMAIYQSPTQGYFIQPRILARTLNIERAIITLVDGALIAQPAAFTNKASPLPSARTTLTEALFFEELQKESPETANALKAFLATAADDGIYLDPATKSASLKWESVDGIELNLGGITMLGEFSTYSVSWNTGKINNGALDAAHTYLAGMAKIINGTVRETPNPYQWYVIKQGSFPKAIEILQKSDEWLALIREYQKKINDAARQD